MTYVVGDEVDVHLDSILDREEDKVYKAYPDPLTHAGPWTIGRGHTGPEVHEGLVWDDNQIEFAYQLDKAAAWQGCYDHLGPWFGKLNAPRRVVLVAMCFQLGIGGLLEFKNTLASVRDERYANAAEGMRASLWGRQTRARANRMASIMDTGVW